MKLTRRKLRQLIESFIAGKKGVMYDPDEDPTLDLPKKYRNNPMIQKKLKQLGQAALSGDAKGKASTDAFARSFDYGEKEGSLTKSIPRKERDKLKRSYVEDLETYESPDKFDLYDKRTRKLGEFLKHLYQKYSKEAPDLYIQDYTGDKNPFKPGTPSYDVTDRLHLGYARLYSKDYNVLERIMMESQAAGYNTGDRVHDRFLNMDPTKPPKYSGRHYKHKTGKYNLTVMET
tara:strand:- start:109 stop:804 length:696 start_codon:yes stop_codon:yes gene_type:complete